MLPKITEETKLKAVKMYKQGNLKVVEISNLLDVSTSVLYNTFKQYREKGLLQQRQGTNEERRKFTTDQERQIAIDYYENNLTLKQLQKKWNIHPMQLQRIRDKFRDQYGFKDYYIYRLKGKNRQ